MTTTRVHPFLVTYEKTTRTVPVPVLTVDYQQKRQSETRSHLRSHYYSTTLGTRTYQGRTYHPSLLLTSYRYSTYLL
jgi:hypothetical protein